MKRWSWASAISPGFVHERPLVLVKGSGVMVYDEHGRDYVQAVSSLYCASLGFSDEELIEAANAQMRALPMDPSRPRRTVPVAMEQAIAWLRWRRGRDLTTPALMSSTHHLPAFAASRGGNRRTG